MKCARLIPLMLAVIPLGEIVAQPSDSNLISEYKQVSQIVNSLHFDKPGQMRVCAIDGSEYTAGQAQWLKAQLHAAQAAVASGNKQAAVSQIEQIVVTLKDHGSLIDTGELFARTSHH